MEQPGVELEQVTKTYDPSPPRPAVSQAVRRIAQGSLVVTTGGNQLTRLLRTPPALTLVVLVVLMGMPGLPASAKVRVQDGTGPSLAVSTTLALTATNTATAVLPAGKATAGSRYVAEIRRTEYGIPHILADDYGSLGYGYGYAFAQDNLCELADRAITLRGERSRYFGPSALSGDMLGASTTNLNSDIYYQSLGESGIVRRLLARPAPLGPTAQARRIVDGYVAGYNRYLHDTGAAHLPDPTCRGKAWVTPITASDMWSLIYDIDTLQGTAANKQAIVTASPPAADATASAPEPPAPAVTNTASNGWALGRDVTQAHDSMVLANPHAPWTGNARLYQVQLTIPGQLNVSGAGLYGTPVVEFGHTEGLAWTATASHAQRYTLYRLTLVPGHPTSYLVDGKAVPMTRQTVTITIRGSDGTLSKVSRTLYSSRYGPLVTGWTNTTAFAVDDANADNLRSVNEWLAMAKSENIAQFRTAQDTYQGLPWLYTLAADSSGTVYFADASVVPHVTAAEEKRCAVGQSRDGSTILDGSTSSCAWGSDPNAIEPGIFGPGNYPQFTRTDYAANSNNSPWTANPSAPLTGYPPVFDTRTELELRPRLSLNMIAQRLAGTDGYGPPGFTLPTLQDTMLGERNYSADLARAAVVAMCRAHPTLTATNGASVNVRAACNVLAAWNGRADRTSRGEVLWHQAYGSLNYSDSWWSVPFSPAQPLATPRDLNTTDPDVQHALADAVQYFQANHMPLDIPLGDTQQYAGIPLPGCTEGEGCFDRSEPDSGSSFIMAVELTPRGPDTRTILTYGESANPNSPHHADQTVLYSGKHWVTERFTQAQINADPHLQTTILRG